MMDRIFGIRGGGVGGGGGAILHELWTIIYYSNRMFLPLSNVGGYLEFLISVVLLLC